MKIEILGSGGAHLIPRAFCRCAICVEARAKGIPYSRSGPSVFIHEMNLLIDTPEEIGYLLNRSQIWRVDGVTYSHWHPDHTAGSRIFEANYAIYTDFDITFPGPRHQTRVLLPEVVEQTFAHNHGLMTRMGFLSRGGVVRVETILDGDSVELNGYRLTPFMLDEDIACGFIIEDGSRRILVCMDELNDWQPSPALGHFDLAILPSGVFGVNPMTGVARMNPDHPYLRSEATHAETMDMVKRLDTERVVFLHLNHLDQFSYSDHCALERHYALSRPTLPPIQFAFDTMIIEV